MYCLLKLHISIIIDTLSEVCSTMVVITADLIHYNLMTPHGNVDMGWVNIGSGDSLLPDQAITWTNIDFYSVSFCVIYLRAISQRVSKLLFRIKSLRIIVLKLLPHHPGASETSNCLALNHATPFKLIYFAYILIAKNKPNGTMYFGSSRNVVFQISIWYWCQKQWYYLSICFDISLPILWFHKSDCRYTPSVMMLLLKRLLSMAWLKMTFWAPNVVVEMTKVSIPFVYIIINEWICIYTYMF